MKKRVISLLITLVLLLSYIGTVVQAASVSVTISGATYYSSGSLKSMTTKFTWNTASASSRLVLQAKRLRSAGESGTTISYGDFTNFGYYGSMFGSFDAVLSKDSAEGTFGIKAYSAQTAVYSGTNTLSIDFNEGQIPLNVDSTYYLYLWTYWSQSGTNNKYYPDQLIAAINVRDGVVKYTPATGTNTYDDSAFAYVEAEKKYSVTVNAAANMTRVSTSGATTQTDLNIPMTPVVYTANENYCFPEDYAVTSVNGIKVTRNSATQITVSGMPTADAAITLKAPTLTLGELENVKFNYAYDVQRNPAYPAVNGSITFSSLVKPYMADGEQKDVNTGTWTLTNLGAYYYLKNTEVDTAGLKNIVKAAADAYNVSPNGVVVHQLKDGSDHVAYGVVVVYDPDAGLAAYIGDALDRGAGYLLSVEPLSGTVTGKATMNTTDWIETYTVGVTNTANGTTTVSVQEAVAGDEIVVTATPNAGYRVAGVTYRDTADHAVTPDADGNYSFAMPAANVTVSVQYALQEYTVTKGNSANGTFEVQPATAVADTAITVTVTPDAGYAVSEVTFNGMSATKVDTNRYTFQMPAKNVTVDVIYYQTLFALSTTHAGGITTGGKYSLDKTEAFIGDTVTVETDANLAYRVESVTLSNGGTVTDLGGGKYTFVMPAEDTVVTVKYIVDNDVVAEQLQILHDKIDLAEENLQVLIDQKADKTELTKAIQELEAAIADAEEKATQADAAQKQELLNNIAAAKAEVVQGYTAAINDAKTELKALIDQKADKTALAEAIADLEELIEAAENKATQADAALKQELLAAIAAAKSEVVDGYTTAINDAKTELKALIDQKADKTALAEAIADLEELIEAAENKATQADAALKQELLAAIAAAKSEVVDGYTTAINDAKTELKALIDQKADKTALAEAIADLEELIEAAENKASQADAALKQELLAAIAAAKSEVVDGYTTAINDAKTELKALIDQKADKTALAEAIADLEELIEAAENKAAQADAALKQELLAAIAAAKSEVVDGYTAAIKDAKDELNALIDQKADKTALNKAIEDLEALIEAAEKKAAQADAAQKEELLNEIEAAKKDLTDAYTAALNDAVTRLEKLIDDQIDPVELAAAIKEVTDIIDKLDDTYATDQQLADAMAQAKDSLKDAVSKLETAIADEVKKLQEQISANDVDIQNHKAQIWQLNQLVIALKEADKVMDGMLTDAVAKAESDLKSAREALEKIDADTKAELEAAIAEGDANLLAAINALQAELDRTKTELDEKDGELSTLGIVALIVACVGILGNIVLAVAVAKKKARV